MRHIIFFTDGSTTEVSEETVEIIVNAHARGGSNQLPKWIIAENQVFALDFITHIAAKEVIENAQSGVVTPPSPQDLRNKAEQDRLKRIANPNALVQGIRQKAEPDHDEDTVS
jgi:hypothetical protein